jgi:hypothetical protein
VPPYVQQREETSGFDGIGSGEEIRGKNVSGVAVWVIFVKLLLWEFGKSRVRADFGMN